MTALLERAVPFDTQPLYLTDWRAMSELLDGPLRGQANRLAVTAPAVGLSVEVATGEASIGGIHVENTSIKTFNCAAADPGHPRIDLIVAGIDYRSRAAYLRLITGTPAPSPRAPTPTVDAYVVEIPLAEVVVAANDAVLAAADVTDRRLMAVPAHGAGGLIARLSVAADAVTTTAITEQIFPGWSLTTPIRGRRRHRIGIDGWMTAANAITKSTRIRDGSTIVETQSPLLVGGYQDGVAAGVRIMRHGIFDDLAEGLHTFIVTNQSLNTTGIRTLLGATQAAVANGLQRPWLTVRDLGPAR